MHMGMGWKERKSIAGSTDCFLLVWLRKQVIIISKHEAIHSAIQCSAQRTGDRPLILLLNQLLLRPGGSHCSK
jgi:hypothetical protein